MLELNLFCKDIENRSQQRNLARPFQVLCKR